MVKLKDLNQEELIGIVEEMSLKFSDEVYRHPGNLIEEAFEIFKSRPKVTYQLCLDLGSEGYKITFKTFDEALEHLERTSRLNPNQIIEATINKLA